jgi:hypothetical protein
MKALLRSLLLWFLLAAVPFGGFASATMLLCAPQRVLAQAPAPAHPAHPVQHAMAAGHHDHAAMLAAQQGEAAGGHAAAHPGGSSSTHHDGANHAGHGKCASTGACCIGAPLASALPAALPLQDGRCATVPFVPAAPAAVDLAGLERPPKPSFA